ncbi:MAG: YihY/virulence factor BrkB family protein [Acidobacteriota bacterium]
MKLPSRKGVADRCRPTLTYWIQTEVHVYALAVAASVMLSFFPFLIVIVSLCRYVLKWPAARGAIYAALGAYFPGEMGEFIVRNLSVTVADRGALQFVSLLLLLFTANGIFIPLEVALNRVWGVKENRSYWRNQAVSTGLIFACGTLALVSTIFTGMNPQFFRGLFGQADGLVEFAGIVLFKIAAVPLSILMLLLVYWRLPNRRIGVHQVIPVAIVVGLALEAIKYVNLLTWPLWREKLRGEYGPFVYSVSIILWSFLGAMLLLAGSEWAARREARLAVQSTS